MSVCPSPRSRFSSWVTTQAPTHSELWVHSEFEDYQSYLNILDVTKNWPWSLRRVPLILLFLLWGCGGTLTEWELPVCISVFLLGRTELCCVTNWAKALKKPKTLARLRHMVKTVLSRAGWESVNSSFSHQKCWFIEAKTVQKTGSGLIFWTCWNISF